MAKHEKFVKKSLAFIDSFSSVKTYQLQAGKTKKHSFNGRQATFEKKDDEYWLNVTTQIIAGNQRHRELDVKKETVVKFLGDDKELYVKGKHLLLNQVQYVDKVDGSMEKSVTLKITSFSTKKFSYYKAKMLYRSIFTLDKKVSLRGDFTGWNCIIDGKSTFEPYLKLFIHNAEYHFFCYSASDSKHYMIIDVMTPILLNEFEKTANAILLTYGFLKGDYHGKDAFILTYETNDFDEPLSLHTNIRGGGIYGGFPIHSTKPHSILSFTNKTKYKKDKSGNVIGIDNDYMKKFMVEFPEEVYAKISELIVVKGGILRAVILFVSNHNTALELKIPSLFVALENITKTLTGGDRSVPKIIDDISVIKSIKTEKDKLIKVLKSIEKSFISTLTSQDEVKICKANFERITNKFHSFNQGSNNSKLLAPFATYGYKLSEEEKDIVLTLRNKFLHGDDFIGLEKSYELEFRELFHLSMKLQKLIAILLLKSCGFSGYILNNSKVYDYISERKLKEDVFIEI